MWRRPKLSLSPRSSWLDCSFPLPSLICRACFPLLHEESPDQSVDVSSHDVALFVLLSVPLWLLLRSIVEAMTPQQLVVQLEHSSPLLAQVEMVWANFDPDFLLAELDALHVDVQLRSVMYHHYSDVLRYQLLLCASDFLIRFAEVIGVGLIAVHSSIATRPKEGQMHCVYDCFVVADDNCLMVHVRLD